MLQVSARRYWSTASSFQPEGACIAWFVLGHFTAQTFGNQIRPPGSKRPWGSEPEGPGLRWGMALPSILQATLMGYLLRPGANTPAATVTACVMVAVAVAD